MTRDWGKKPDKGSINEKTLNNKGKNRHIEIDEKLSTPVETEEENWSAGKAGYNIFAFLFWVLVAAGRPRFCLVLQD